jgi:hypothetical protein
MKMRDPHIVPLSRQAVEMLRPIDVLPIVPKGTASPGAVGLRAPKSRKTPGGVLPIVPKEH